jgi:hypothetical protein
MAGILATDTMQISRGGSEHPQQTQLTIFCTQVASSLVHCRPVHWELAVLKGDGLRRPDTLIGQQPWRPSTWVKPYLHSSGWREAAADSEMPRAQKGSNDLAKALETLSLAARAEEDSKANTLGLGAAKAHREEEQRKAEDQHRRERREVHRQLDQETAAATANTTQEEAQLHAGLQGIKGTPFGIRVQRTVASNDTSRQVLAITTEMRSIQHFKELDVKNAITIVLANLAMANTHTALMLAKLRVGTYCDCEN